MVGLLLLQDLLAIIVLMVLLGAGGDHVGEAVAISLLGLPLLIGAALLLVPLNLLDSPRSPPQIRAWRTSTSSWSMMISESVAA